MSSINLTDSETPKIPGRQEPGAMSAKPLKTACELGDIIVEQAIAYGWTASISAD
jgi:hypothetical protein